MVPVRFEMVIVGTSCGRVDESVHADLANPWLVWAHYLAHRRAEARDWTRRVRFGSSEGWFPVLRALDIGAERVAEVLEEMGVLVDDRRPAFEDWLDRKLDGLAPGISREVETWQRALHDGGPRTRARHRSTGNNYLNCVLPSLKTWSGRYHHLREVTRDDVLAVLATVHGAQRSNTIVALRSLIDPWVPAETPSVWLNSGAWPALSDIGTKSHSGARVDVDHHHR